jgi:hypothetical protein
MDGAGKKASTKASMSSLGMLFLSASVSAAAGNVTGHAMHTFRVSGELDGNWHAVDLCLVSHHNPVQQAAAIMTMASCRAHAVLLAGS